LLPVRNEKVIEIYQKKKKQLKEEPKSRARALEVGGDGAWTAGAVFGRGRARVGNS